MSPGPKTRVCERPGCDNEFSVAYPFHQKKYCGPECSRSIRSAADRHVYPFIQIRFGEDNDRLWALAAKQFEPGHFDHVTADVRKKELEPEVRRIVRAVVHDFLDQQKELNQPADDRVLPELTAECLRELRASGNSYSLSAMLEALNAAGWSFAALGQALGISRQAVQKRTERTERT